MSEHRVVELEKAELHAFAALADLDGGLGDAVVAVAVLQLLKDDLGALDDAGRHAGELGHVDTEGVGTATGHELAKEDDLLVDFFHRHVVVVDAREGFFHLVELVIVRGEEGARMAFGVFVEKLDDGPGDGDAVVSRGAAAQLVEEHEAAIGETVHDGGGFAHLDHEGGLAHRDVVAGADAGENFVDDANACAFGRYEAAHLGEQHDEGRLAQQGRLTGHVGTGDDDDLLLLGVEAHVVGDVGFAGRHLGFDDGVAAFDDFELGRLVDLGTDVMTLFGHPGQIQVAVEGGQLGGVVLQRADVGQGSGEQFLVDACFEDEDALVGAHNLLFIFLQLLGDVTLGADQGLLAHPFGRHFVLERIPHLQVVAEDVVESDLETLDAGPLGFALLQVGEVLPAVGRNAAQVVEFGIHAVGNVSALVGERGRVGREGGGNAVAQGGEGVHAAADVAKRRQVARAAGLTNGTDNVEVVLQLLHLARIDAAGREL